MLLAGINLSEQERNNEGLMRKLGRLPDNVISAPSIDIYVSDSGEVVELTQTYQSDVEHRQIGFNVPRRATDVSQTVDVRYGTNIWRSGILEVSKPKLLKLPANWLVRLIPYTRIEGKKVEFTFDGQKYRLKTAFEIGL